MALLHATQSHEPAKDVTPFPSLDLLGVRELSPTANHQGQVTTAYRDGS